jgi:2-methylisocitrate lyase-like PEP mutase family enzyme
MAGKIKAAVDARASTETLIMARTDAVAVEGLDAALERAERYLEAGADILFIEALRTAEQMKTALARVGDRVPMLANMVEGGKTPLLSAGELEALGYRLVIFPGGLVRALTRTTADYFANLKATGTTAAFRERMLDFDQLNDVLGTQAYLDLGKRYDS